MDKLTSHYRATLRLGWPIAVGQIGIIAVGFADTLMVGRYATDALAAASFVNSIFNLVFFVSMGYAYGLTPLLGRLFGQKHYREAGGMLKAALAANLLYGALLMAGMGMLYLFVDRLGQPVELLPLIRPYFLIVLASLPFALLFNVLRQFTDAATHTAVGMWILLASNVVNIVGNYLLINGIGPFPEWGLCGAGVSTLLARVLTAVAIMAVLLWSPRYRTALKGFRAVKMTRRNLLNINRHSLPVSLQMGMETGAFTFSTIMVGWLGAVPLAGYQVMLTISTLGFLFYYSFGAGVSIRIAHFSGANDPENVRRSARAGCHILLLLAAAASTVFIVLGKPLTQLFTQDRAVQAVTLSLLLPLAVYQFGDAMQICFANCLRGTSHVMSMMWIAAVSYLLIGIPSGYLLGFTFGLGEKGIVLALAIGLFTAATLFWAQFRKVTSDNVIIRK